MSGEPLDLAPACRAVNVLLAGVREDQFSAPTPCGEYTVRDLIDHLDVVADGVGDTAGSHNWRAVIAERITALGERWADPAAWRGTRVAGDLELTNAVWGRIALTELVVHGWDLAVATGQPFELPEPTLRGCLEHVEVFVPSAPLPQLWGDPVEVPADASVLARVLAVTGRDPQWAP